MCLAIPGRVESCVERDGLKMGQVSFSGVTREVCFAYVPEVKTGDYVLVHVGFAISVVDEREALRTLELLDSLALEMEEDGEADPT